MMKQNLTEWDEDVVSTPEEDYQSFLRGLSWRDGFGIEFVRCSPASGQDLIEKVKRDLPQRKVEVLTLSEPIDNLIQIVQGLPNYSELDVLFVVGLDKSLTDYIRTGYGGQGEYYNLDTVPPILSHLNWQRENFRDRFPNLCFVFLLPQFAIKSIIRRAPDFYDWASGKTDIPSSQELVSQESQRILGQDFGDYLEWTPLQRKERILEINELLLELDQSQDQQASLLLELGNIFVTTNQYEEAITAFGRGLQAKPDSLQALFMRSFTLGLVGKYEEAISTFDKGFSIKSDDYQIWYIRGFMLFYFKKNEEAIASLDRALEFKPDYHEAWYYRGGALLNLGRYEEAITSFDRVLAIKSDNLEVFYLRGISPFKLKRYEEALTDYDRALETKSDDHQIWYIRGMALHNLGKYEEAISSYDRALEIKSDDHQIWHIRGNTLCNLGRYEEAISSYNRGLEIKPDEHEAWYNRGNALRKLGRYEEAIVSYEKALEIKPDAPSPYYNKACTYSRQNKIELALENLQKAIQINPEKYHETSKIDSDFDNIRHDPRFQALIQ